MCKVPLGGDTVVGKLFGKTRQSSDYLFHIIERSIDQANSIFLYLDKDLKPIMCNKAIESITGYRRSEIFKDNWLNLFFRKNPSRMYLFKVTIESCLSSIKSRTYEGSITKKDGSECILSWRNAAITDDSGAILGILCIAQDITEHKNSEDDLAYCSEHLRDIFTSIKDYALITTNLKDKITYYGANSIELFGWKDDMTLKDISILFSGPDRNSKKSSIKKSIAKSGNFESDTTLLRSNGEEFPAAITATTLVNKKKGKSGYVYVVRDITEKKKIERQMVRNEKMAAIGQLAAGIAHEINNPLLVILGRLDMLSMDGDDLSPAVKQTSETIKTQAQRIRTIIDRLLSYSRKKTPHMDLLDINDVLKSVSPLIAYYPEFKKITWKEELTEGLPLAEGDFNQLQEVFLNLALNACQAMPDGGNVTIVSKNAGDGFIEVSVTDTGKGISKEDMDRLFTPFFTTKDDGTGLGLSMCHNSIETHNGKIIVESVPGTGTTFKVKLPVFKKE